MLKRNQRVIFKLVFLSRSFKFSYFRYHMPIVSYCLRTLENVFNFLIFFHLIINEKAFWEFKRWGEAKTLKRTFNDPFINGLSWFWGRRRLQKYGRLLIKSSTRNLMKNEGIIKRGSRKEIKNLLANLKWIKCGIFARIIIWVKQCSSCC